MCRVTMRKTSTVFHELAYGMSGTSVQEKLHPRASKNCLGGAQWRYGHGTSLNLGAPQFPKALQPVGMLCKGRALAPSANTVTTVISTRCLRFPQLKGKTFDSLFTMPSTLNGTSLVVPHSEDTPLKTHGRDRVSQ